MTRIMKRYKLSTLHYRCKHPNRFAGVDSDSDSYDDARCPATHGRDSDMRGRDSDTLGRDSDTHGRDSNTHGVTRMRTDMTRKSTDVTRI